MIEILEDEKKVLGCLMHAEKLKTIIEETGLPSKVVLDIVRSLWHYRFIKAVDSIGKEVSMVDIDLLHRANFTMTAKGLNAWQEA